MNSVLIATSPETLRLVESGDVVITDYWEIKKAADREGIECYDLREVLADEPERVDAAVLEWADRLFELDEPSWKGISLAPALRSDLTWQVFFPIARHAITACLLARDGHPIVVDLPRGSLICDAIIAGAAHENGKVSQVPGGRPLSLPPSHKAVTPEVGRSLQRYRALRRISPLISARSRVTSSGLDSRPRIAVSYYPSLVPVLEYLVDKVWITLWPWALPPPREAIAMIARGGSCLDPATPADSVDLDQVREAFGHRLNAQQFEASGIDVTDAVRFHTVRAAHELLRFALYRTAAAHASLCNSPPDAVLVPFDLGLSAAPLVLAANKLGIPTILLQHGAEGSLIPGDKRLASTVVVWSEQIANRYRGEKGYGNPDRFRSAGAAMLEPLKRLSKTSTDDRSTILFLSHPVLHNTACDSWMSSEHYVETIAEVVSNLPAEITVKGLKIHPSESADYYRNLMEMTDLDIPLFSEGLLPELLSDVDLVAGPPSTGLLEAWVAGRTPICLNFGSIPMVPPFDGATDIPVIPSALVLVDLLRRWREKRWSLAEPATELAKEIGVIDGAIERTGRLVLNIASTGQAPTILSTGSGGGNDA